MQVLLMTVVSAVFVFTGRKLSDGPSWLTTLFLMTFASFMGDSFLLKLYEILPDNPAVQRMTTYTVFKMTLAVIGLFVAIPSANERQS
jgi:hypothetical protein